LHGTVSYVSKILRKISVTWDVDNSSSYCRFEDVQLEDDDLETQFVAGVSADLSNSRKSVRSKSPSPAVVGTVELNSDNDND
jgi:hypothetical protein